VIGDRKVAPLAILSSNDVAILWTSAWYLLNYAFSPLRSACLTLIEGFLPLRVACKACVNVLRAQLISARVDFAFKAFPGVVAAPLLLGEKKIVGLPRLSSLFLFSLLSPSSSLGSRFSPLSFSPSLSLSLSSPSLSPLSPSLSPLPLSLVSLSSLSLFPLFLSLSLSLSLSLFSLLSLSPGTLAGGAGKMATDPLLAAAGHPPSPAAEFSSPGFSLRSAALGALWQAAAAHWIPFLTERQAGAALAAVLVLHGAAVDVHSWWAAGKGKGKGKRTFDFTAGPARLLHAVSGVPPAPASSAGGARGGAGEKKKAATAAAAVTAATAATGARSATRKKSA
jgi:hypothetical protein